MSKNQLRVTGARYRVVATDPASPASGDPCVAGQIPGVAVAPKLADGTTVLAFDGIFSLSVKGIDGSGNSAVNLGDIIYYAAGDDPQPLSKKATGVRFGYAVGPEGATNPLVASGATAVIAVKVGF